MGVASLGVWVGAGYRGMREAGFVKSEASLVEREVRFMKREAEGSLVVPDLVVRCLLPDRRSDRSLALAALIVRTAFRVTPNP